MSGIFPRSHLPTDLEMASLRSWRQETTDGFYEFNIPFPAVILSKFIAIPSGSFVVTTLVVLPPAITMLKDMMNIIR